MEEMEVIVKRGLQAVRENIKTAYAKLPNKKHEVRLVAVSKTKPKEYVIAAYKEGQRDFGENYVNELVEKGDDPDILSTCPEIRWHFIGHLQRNKVNKVVNVKGLSIVESVHSDTLATALNSAWKKIHDVEKCLKVMVQVNTSNEDEKNGVRPEDAPELAKHIVDNCPSLNLVGVMTIGRFGHDFQVSGNNPDFLTLIKCREAVAAYLNCPVDNLELSMGMTADYEHAIALGSTNVRVGTAIFGERNKKVTS